MQNQGSSPDQVRMWWVSGPDGDGGHLFAGDLQSVVQHINALHRQTGLQHATHEVSGARERGGLPQAAPPDC